MIKQITVLNQIYTIEIHKDLSIDSGCNGYCDFDSSTIAIDADLNVDEMKKTMLHEIGHAFASELGLNETLDISAQEMFASCFSNFICSQFNWSLKD